MNWRRIASGLWRGARDRPAGGDAPGEDRYLLYHTMQELAIRQTPAYPADRFGGAGIVIVAGGPRYFTNAWVCLTILRRVLGCRLPIQVWYLGPSELSARMIALLAPFDVECVDALEVRRAHPTRAIGGWECKPFAILYCPFQEVILLDADNVPLVDPAVFLASPQFRRAGAIFWPDLMRRGREHPIWEICRVPYRDEPEFESGQIVVDKARCWKALHLTRHLNDWSDFYYPHLHGDKGTYQMAWRMLDAPFAMPPYPPRQIIGYIGPDDVRSAGVLHQHDFEGRAVFHHRTGAKWSAWGENLRVPGFPFEEQCLEALRDLRQRWDGRVDPPPSRPGLEGEIIRTRYFLYRQIGSGQRVLALLPGGLIGDGRALWERAWRLEQSPRPTLVIEGHDVDTCRLVRDADGIWRGQWLRDVRMPIELVPLEPQPADPTAPLRPSAPT